MHTPCTTGTGVEKAGCASGSGPYAGSSRFSDPPPRTCTERPSRRDMLPRNDEAQQRKTHRREHFPAEMPSPEKLPTLFIKEVRGPSAGSDGGTTRGPPSSGPPDGCFPDIDGSFGSCGISAVPMNRREPVSNDNSPYWSGDASTAWADTSRGPASTSRNATSTPHKRGHPRRMMCRTVFMAIAMPASSTMHVFTTRCREVPAHG